jgi:predicted dithiol-disulfide oxidoreductase (DUF899 family)
MARQQLLAKEKTMTRLQDELSEERRRLPRVQVDKEYAFEGPNGVETLAELFEGRSQLVIYHFMFGPDDEVGCPHCSLRADGFDGINIHLKHRDVTMIAVSRAPYKKLAAYRKRMGWGFKWMSWPSTISALQRTFIDWRALPANTWASRHYLSVFTALRYFTSILNLWLFRTQ